MLASQPSANRLLNQMHLEREERARNKTHEQQIVEDKDAEHDSISEMPAVFSSRVQGACEERRSADNVAGQQMFSVAVAHERRQLGPDEPINLADSDDELVHNEQESATIEQLKAIGVTDPDEQNRILGRPVHTGPSPLSRSSPGHQSIPERAFLDHSVPIGSVSQADWLEEDFVSEGESQDIEEAMARSMPTQIRAGQTMAKRTPNEDSGDSDDSDDDKPIVSREDHFRDIANGAGGGGGGGGGGEGGAAYQSRHDSQQLNHLVQTPRQNRVVLEHDPPSPQAFAISSIRRKRETRGTELAPPIFEQSFKSEKKQRLSDLQGGSMFTANRCTQPVQSPLNPQSLLGVSGGDKSKELTQEQWERIERNKAAALERKKKTEGSRFKVVGGQAEACYMDCEGGQNQENSDANRKRTNASVSPQASARQPKHQQNASVSDPGMMGPPQKKTRGRPKGSKDSKPRKQRGKVAAESANVGRGSSLPRGGHSCDLPGSRSAAMREAACEGPQQPQIPSQPLSPLCRPRPHGSGSPALPAQHAAPGMPQTSANVQGVQDGLRSPADGVLDRDAPPSRIPQPPGGGVQAEGPAGPLFVLPPEEVWGKVYADQRPWMTSTLSAIAQSKLGHAHVFQNHVRALMQIALYPFPIYQLAEAKKIPGVGPESLRELERAARTRVAPPAEGKFTAAAAAALVAMLDFERQKGDGDDGLCSREELVLRTHARMDPCCLGDALRADDGDVGWAQVQKLMKASTNSPQYIKELRHNAQTKARGYALSDAGRETAAALLAKQWGRVARGPHTHLKSDDGTMAPAFAGAVMALDFREGGGVREELFETMCEALDRAKQPYFARSLPVADYLWLCHGTRLAPVLVERKSAVDIAHSIHDGRWRSQQNRMLKARSVYPGMRLRLVYMIEGDVEKSAGGKSNLVGEARWRITVGEVEMEVAALAARGFEVIKTRSINESLRRLAEIHADVACQARNGALRSCVTWLELDAALKAATVTPAHGSERTLPQAAPRLVHGDVAGGVGAVGTAAVREGERAVGVGVEEGIEKEELMKLSAAELKERCKMRGETISGNKTEMVNRLLGPRKPQLWVDRKLAERHHPKLESANTAILVALLLRNGPMTKSEILDKAETTSISKETMYKCAGSLWYGWSNHTDLVKDNLMREHKVNCGKSRWTLTEDGRALADVMHKWAHEKGKCKCGRKV